MELQPAPPIPELEAHLVESLIDDLLDQRAEDTGEQWERAEEIEINHLPANVIFIRHKNSVRPQYSKFINKLFHRNFDLPVVSIEVEHLDKILEGKQTTDYIVYSFMADNSLQIEGYTVGLGFDRSEAGRGVRRDGTESDVLDILEIIRLVQHQEKRKAVPKGSA